MTVQADFTPVQVTLTTGTDVITVPNYVLEEDEILVIRTRSGVNTTLTLNTDYTVTGEGDEAGCTVTMIGQAAADTITIYRDMNFTQENDLLDGEKRSGPQTEKVYDRLTMQNQQLREVTERSLRLPRGETLGNDGELPDVETRKGKILIFDEDTGLPSVANQSAAVGITSAARQYGTVAAMTTDASITAVSNGQAILLRGYYSDGDFGEPVYVVVETVGGIDAKSGSATHGDQVGIAGCLSYKLADNRYANLYPSTHINVKWTGAKGDGFMPNDFSGSTTTDDRAGIQAAINLANNQYSKCREVYLPGGAYNIKSHITVNGTTFGLCFNWSDTKTNPAPQDSASSTGTDNVGGLRIRGESWEQVATSNPGWRGTLISYLGTTVIDAVCGVDGDGFGYTGFQDLVIAGYKYSTTQGFTLHAANYDYTAYNTLTGLTFWDTVIKANRCYWFKNSGSTKLRSYRTYENIETRCSLICNFNAGYGFACRFINNKHRTCMDTGFYHYSATNMKMEHCTVTNYFLKGFHLEGQLYYTNIESSGAEGWSEPDNPDFNPLGSAPATSSATHRPWFHKQTYYWEDYDAEKGLGAAFYVNNLNAHINFISCFSEGSRQLLYSEQRGGTFSIQSLQGNIDNGTRGFFTTKGQLTSDVAAAAKGGTATFNVDFDPSTALSDGDFVFVGRRTSLEGNGWDAKYSAADNFTSWQATTGNSSLAVLGGTVYGHWYQVGTRTATSFVGTRMDGAGGFWTFNEDASDWPSGTRTHKGTGGSEDYVALVERETVALFEWLAGSNDSRFNCTRLNLVGGNIGTAGDTSDTQNPRFSGPWFGTGSIYDKINIQSATGNRILGTTNDVDVYEEDMADQPDTDFGGNLVYRIYERATGDDVKVGTSEKTVITPKSLFDAYGNVGSRLIPGVSEWLYFDGTQSSSRYDPGAGPSVMLGEAHTFGFWIKTSTDSAFVAFIGNDQFSSNGWELSGDSSGTLTLEFKSSSTSRYKLSYDVGYNDDTWPMIVLEMDWLSNTATAAPSVVLYFDGVAVTGTVDTAYNGTYSSTATFIELFARNSTLPYDGYFSGFVHFNRTLSAAEALALFQGSGGSQNINDQWATEGTSTSGTLTVGQKYRINDFQTGDDFTNVGASSNATGEVFVATGTTPTTWSNSSELENVGVLAEFPQDEGVGYLLHDKSPNNYDILLDATGFTWGNPKIKGSIRDFNLDANGAAAYVLSSSRDTLPANAIVTRVLVKNNDAGNITSGNFDVNRYDGTNRATIGDNGAQIDAGDSFVIYPNATQDTADRRIEIPNNSDAGMDDFDITVHYEIIG